MKSFGKTETLSNSKVGVYFVKKKASQHLTPKLELPVCLHISALEIPNQGKIFPFLVVLVLLGLQGYLKFYQFAKILSRQYP